MAYKIRIKHDFEGKILPIHLKYNDSNYELPEISVDLTDSYQVVPLYDWEAIVSTLDASKVSVVETDVKQGMYIYKFNSIRIIFEEEPSTEGREHVPLTLKIRYVQTVMRSDDPELPSGADYRETGRWEAHAWLDTEDNVMFPLAITAPDGSVKTGTASGAGHGTVIPNLFIAEREYARPFVVVCDSTQYNQAGTKYYTVDDIKVSYDTLPAGANRKYEADGYSMYVGGMIYDYSQLDDVFFMFGAGTDLARTRITRNSYSPRTIINDADFDLTKLVSENRRDIASYPLSNVDIEEREFGFKRLVLPSSPAIIVCIESPNARTQTGAFEGKCILKQNGTGIKILDENMSDVTELFWHANIEYYDYTYNDDGTVATQQTHAATVFLGRQGAELGTTFYICKEGGIFDNNE